jgi:hypothetical protein
VVDIAEKAKEARLRWYGLVMTRNDGELVKDYGVKIKRRPKK